MVVQKTQPRIKGKDCKFEARSRLRSTTPVLTTILSALIMITGPRILEPEHMIETERTIRID